MDNERACWKAEYLEGMGWCIIDQEKVRTSMHNRFPLPGDETEPGLVAYGYASRDQAQADIDDPTSFFWSWLRSYLESDHPRQQCLIFELFEGQPGHLAQAIRREATLIRKRQAMLDRAWAISPDAQGEFELGLMSNDEIAEIRRELEAQAASQPKRRPVMRRSDNDDDDEIPF